MKVKELVDALKKITECYPVVLMKGKEVEGLSREFCNDGTTWEQISFIIKDPKILDTEFLKHILDYCAKEEFRSLFSDETPFVEFEVCASKKQSECIYSSVSVVKCGVEEVNNKTVFALHVEEMC